MFRGLFVYDFFSLLTWSTCFNVEDISNCLRLQASFLECIKINPFIREESWLGLFLYCVTHDLWTRLFFKLQLTDVLHLLLRSHHCGLDMFLCLDWGHVPLSLEL